MKPIRSLANLNSSAERAFTLLELLVALSLFSVIGALVCQALAFQSTTYLTDIGRIRVQQNLRGALDIIAMNVRQSGEGLPKYFPAMILSSGTKLTTRRKILHDVLTACKPVSAGDARIFVSDGTSSDTQCIPTNIASSLSAWTSYLAGENPMRIYIFDQVTKTGEFVDVTAKGNFSGSDFLAVTAPTHNYPIRSTSLYVIEEYAFNLDIPNDTLQLNINGKVGAPQDVAYKITDFKTSLEMQDGTILLDLNELSPKSWKDVRSVQISLTGEETWKTTTVLRKVSGNFFPRNILSQ